MAFRFFKAMPETVAIQKGPRPLTASTISCQEESTRSCPLIFVGSCLSYMRIYKERRGTRAKFPPAQIIQ